MPGHRVSDTHRGWLRTHTQVNKIQSELVDLMSKVLCRNGIYREAGKTTRKITVNELVHS